MGYCATTAGTTTTQGPLEECKVNKREDRATKHSRYNSKQQPSQPSPASSRAHTHNIHTDKHLIPTYLTLALASPFPGINRTTQFLKTSKGHGLSQAKPTRLRRSVHAPCNLMRARLITSSAITFRYSSARQNTV